MREEEEKPSHSHVSAPTPAQPRAPMTRLQQLKADEEAAENEYVIVNMTLLESLLNSSINNHRSTSPQCTQPNFKLIKDSQKFISVGLKLECRNCEYKGKAEKMYHEMEKPLNSFSESGEGGSNRGNRASTLNASLAAAVTNSMIGVTQCRRLFLEIGVDVGAASTLQILCNQVSDLTKMLARNSMDKGLEELKEQAKKGKATHISGDAMYNNRSGSRPGPCQAGTQVVYTSVGSNGKILAFNTFNKLCPKGKRLEGKGLGSCEDGHPGCIQTLNEVAPISQEGKMALEALFSFREKGFIPDYLAVDGDTQIRDKVEEFNAECEKEILVQYDPNHWARNLEKYLNKNKAFVDDGTFHGASKKDIKRLRQGTIKKLSLDISNRCKSEIKLGSQLTVHFTDSEERLKEMQGKFTSNLRLAISDCIQGKCGDMCKEHSLLCEGKGKEQSRKAMIGEHIELKGENLKVAKDRIDEYFKEERISQVFMQLDTNINEALHRGYQRTNPKLTTFARNYVGRVSREVIHFNEGIAKSAEMINDAIGHKTCANVKEKLKKEQKLKEYQTMYSKKKTTKKRRFQRLSDTYKKHAKYQRDNKKTKTKSPYKKGIDLTV